MLQTLGFMWAVAACLAIGSYALIPASIIGHAVLIGAAVITVATYTTAFDNVQRMPLRISALCGNPSSGLK